MKEDKETTGDAAQAFEDLRAEVSVLRRAVESLPEEWEANQPPDYTESLGQITQGLSMVVGRLQAIEQHPALRATPAQPQTAIMAAGRDLMSQAAGRIDQAAEAFKREQQNLAGVIGTVRTQRQQREWLTITAGAALMVGLLVSPFAARLLPFGWNGRLAAYILNANRWEAGATLMAAENPKSWVTLGTAAQLWRINQPALEACRAAAAKTQKEQHCTISVPAP